MVETAEAADVKTWAGVAFTEQWLITPGGGVLFYRCETCNALIKPHDLDLIRHAEWHGIAS